MQRGNMAVYPRAGGSFRACGIASGRSGQGERSNVHAAATWVDLTGRCRRFASHRTRGGNVRDAQLRMGCRHCRRRDRRHRPGGVARATSGGEPAPPATSPEGGCRTRKKGGVRRVSRTPRQAASRRVGGWRGRTWRGPSELGRPGRGPGIGSGRCVPGPLSFSPRSRGRGPRGRRRPPCLPSWASRRSASRW
jgi:hypothetical protein